MNNSSNNQTKSTNEKIQDFKKNKFIEIIQKKDTEEEERIDILIKRTFDSK